MSAAQATGKHDTDTDFLIAVNSVLLRDTLKHYGVSESIHLEIEAESEGEETVPFFSPGCI